MFPVFTYAPTFEYPLSGNVTQAISPSFEIEGVWEIEHEVVTSVASYGKQLGKLTEAVLALADAIDLPPEAQPAITAVREISEGVEEAKTRAVDALRAKAELAAARLAKVDGSDQ